MIGHARFSALLLTAVLASVSLIMAAIVTAADAVHVESLDGQSIDPLRISSDLKAVVYVFVSVDCPVSNRYAPEVRRLHDRFAAQGVRFTLVYPNPAESPASIRDHLLAYAYPVGAFRDPTHSLVKHARISITPEVAVFTPDGTLKYRGRIDDRHVRLGLERPAATTHDLADALTSVIAGTAVRTPRTQAVGCYVADFAR